MPDAPCVPACVAVRHFSASAYYYGCKSPEAKQRRSEQRKRSDYLAKRGMPARVSAVGFIRRYRALCCLGWTTDTQIEMAGIRFDITHIMRRGHVHRSTHDAMVKLYDRLWDTPGPSSRTRLLAKRKGWLPPMAWDDDELDNPEHISSEEVFRAHIEALAENRRFERLAAKRRARAEAAATLAPVTLLIPAPRTTPETEYDPEMTMTMEISA